MLGSHKKKKKTVSHWCGFIAPINPRKVPAFAFLNMKLEYCKRDRAAYAQHIHEMMQQTSRSDWKDERLRGLAPHRKSTGQSDKIFICVLKVLRKDVTRASVKAESALNNSKVVCGWNAESGLALAWCCHVGKCFLVQCNFFIVLATLLTNHCVRSISIILKCSEKQQQQQ